MWELAPDVTCLYYPEKRIYRTADQASCALRSAAIKFMRRGSYSERLVVYPCQDHWHLGKLPEPPIRPLSA